MPDLRRSVRSHHMEHMHARHRSERTTAPCTTMRRQAARASCHSAAAPRPAFVSATAALRADIIVKPVAAALASLLTMMSPSAALCLSNHTHHTSQTHSTTTTTTTTSLNPALLFARARRRANGVEDVAERKRRKVLQEAYHVLRERYVHESQVNWTRVARHLKRRSVDSDEQLHKSLMWLFSRCDDSFTRYLTPTQLASMKDDMDGEMCGVGIVFSAETRSWRRASHIVVKQVLKNSPAEQGGVQKGDAIVAIDLQHVRTMSTHDAAARLLGNHGRKVLLSVRRNGNELQMLLTRRRFQVPTVWWQRVNIRDVGDVGYLHVREFATHTAREVRAALRALRRREDGRCVTLYVLDLRGNSGGLVERAVDVAKLFLRRGQLVVRFIGRDGAQSTERAGWRARARAPTHEGAMTVVLVDGDTASASELVAGALADNCRAVLVGAATFGKGSVQAIVSLSNGGGAAVTVGEYRTPRHARLSRGRGLRPQLRRGALGDGERAVRELFERDGARRARWVQAKLRRCRERAQCD